MNLRCKKPRPLRREEATYRDDRLFIVATEDTHAPEAYFRLFQNPRIKVRVLPTQGGLSAPEHVLQRWDDFVREFEKIEEDEFWLMLDTDHWTEPNHVANFTAVCAEAIKKGFTLAHSNPCFEIWLLLHLEDLKGIQPFRQCHEVVQRLQSILGSYNKRSIDADKFSMAAAGMAVSRAEQSPGTPGERWPQRNGSHVYLLVKKLLGT